MVRKSPFHMFPFISIYYVPSTGDITADLMCETFVGNLTGLLTFSLLVLTPRTKSVEHSIWGFKQTESNKNINPITNLKKYAHTEANEKNWAQRDGFMYKNMFQISFKPEYVSLNLKSTTLKIQSIYKTDLFWIIIIVNTHIF